MEDCSCKYLWQKGQWAYTRNYFIKHEESEKEYSTEWDAKVAAMEKFGAMEMTLQTVRRHRCDEFVHDEYVNMYDWCFPRSQPSPLYYSSDDDFE